MQAAAACLLVLSIATVCCTDLLRQVRSQPSDNACATSCPGVSSEVQYEVGKSYVFDVTSRAVLKFAKKFDTDVTQTLHAKISVHSPCEYSLKVSGATLKGIEVENAWSSILESHPLRFSFDDGNVKTICPNVNDPVWSVNIKRAILSAFQTNHEVDSETDITGECPVKVEKQKSGRSLSIKTSKNATACHRTDDLSGIRAVAYQSLSKIQSLPLLDATQTCSRRLEDGNLQEVKCTEHYQLMTPLEGAELISLDVEQSLKAAGVAAAERLDLQHPIKRESLVYDHVEDNLNSRGSVQVARSIINELCKPSDRVGDTAASSFSDLVHHLRGLSDLELSSLTVHQCNAFTDALAACGSGNCIAQLSRIINSGTVRDSIYRSLASITEPEIGIIDSVASFIEKAPLQGLLPITSLVQSYCIEHPDCGNHASVDRIIRSLMGKLPSGCRVPNQFEEIKKAVIVLKALGNIGFENQSMSTIIKCIDDIPIQIRLTAIDALRRKPCSEQQAEKLERIYTDQKENVEVRIASFRQLMQCADAETLTMIVNSLESETINQVGSYVWSYLNTKRRSTKPESVHLQHILKRFHLPSRFNIDPWRFSRFFELGYFDKQDNYGAHMDTSIVFTPDGYIPREAALNFTVHLFSKSINILELGVRAEGLEQADDELFGADGFISNPNGHVFREKKFRSRYDKINHLIELSKRKHNDQSEHRVTATFYTRMFGDDLYYYGFEKQDILEEIKANVDLDKVLTRLASPTEYNIDRNILLFELAQTLPTLTGLPLQLALNASMAVRIDHKMKFNLIDLLRQRADADAFVNSQPSISLSRGIEVVLRAGSVASGVLMEANAYSATSVMRQMELQQGRRLSLKIEVPKSAPSLVAKMSNEVIRVDSNRHQKLGDPAGRRHPRQTAPARQFCSSETISKITGLQACFQAENDFPNVKAGLELKKVDPGLQFYQLLVERSNSKDSHKLLMSVDTPGSQVNRRLEANFDLSFVAKTLQMSIITPFKKLIVDGQLMERRRFEDYDTKLKLTIDDRDQYSMDGTIKATKDGERNKYNLNAKATGGTEAGIEAEVQYSNIRPFASIDFQLNKVFSKPIIFRTLLNPEKPKYEAKLEYSSPEFSGKLDGSAVHSKLFNLKGSVDGEYQIGSQQKREFSLGFEQELQRSSSEHHLKHEAHLKVPGLRTIEYQLVSDRKGNQLNNLIETTFLDRKSSLKLDITRSANELYNAVGQVKSDRFGLDNKVTIAYQNRFPMQFMLKIDAETPKAKGLHASAHYIVKVDPKWNMISGIRLARPDTEIVLENSINEIRTGRFKMVTHLQWQPRSQIDADSNVVYSPREYEYGIESNVRYTGMPEPIIFKKHVHYEPANYKTHLSARHGQQILYEMIGVLEGKVGQPQKISFDMKSEKFGPRINYQLAADVIPSSEAVAVAAVIQKDGSLFARGNVSFPRRLEGPERKFRGEFLYNYNFSPRKLVIEWNSRKDGRGCSNEVKLQSENKLNLDVLVECYDRVRLKCILEKDLKTVINSELHSTPIRFDQFEVDGHLNTDDPLPKKSIKTKAMFNYARDQAALEARLEIDGQRHLLNGQWRKQLQGTQRHYTYSGKIETPQGHLHIDQQLQVAMPFAFRKCQTGVEIDCTGRRYNLKNEVNWNGRTLNSITNLNGKDLDFKHVADYTRQNNQINFKKQITLNGKEAETGIVAVYRNNEVKFDLDMTSAFGALKKLKSGFGCRKGDVFWNCEAEYNLNDKYIAKGHETFSMQLTDIGFTLKLADLLDNEGKVSLGIDERSSKYHARAFLQKSNEKYNFELDVAGDHGTLSLQTPTQTIGSAKVKLVRKGPHEFELQSESSGSTKGKIYATILNSDYDKQFKLQVTEIEFPFELNLARSLSGGKQLSTALFTALRDKKHYGIENEINFDGAQFRSIRGKLTYPQRQVESELQRPTDGHIILSLQPNVGSNRSPTVFDLKCQMKTETVDCQSSFNDPAMQHPLKATLRAKKLGNDQHNYGVELATELDYSGQPEKLLTNSFLLQRSVLPASAADGAPGDIRYIVELRRSHPASNLFIHAWAKVDRRTMQLTSRTKKSSQTEVLVPVYGSLGLEVKNKHRKPVEYSLTARADGYKFAEYMLKSPESMLKARLDKISDQHYTVGFYRNSEQPTLVGDLTVEKRGVVLEFRDEKTGNVKLHGSALMPTDYELEMEVWHGVDSKKIRDALFSIQVDENNLLKGNVYLRPAVEGDLIKNAKQLITEAKSPDRHSVFEDAIMPVVAAQKTLATDMLSVVGGTIRSWSDEQRKIAAEVGPVYGTIFDELESSYEGMREAILHSYDRIDQAVAQYTSTMSQGEIVQQLRDLKASSGRLPAQIASAFRPMIELLGMIAKEVDELQKNATNAMDYIEKTLKIDEFKAYLDEYRQQFESADFVAILLQNARKLSREYRLPEVEGQIADIEQNRGKYKSKALSLYNQVKDVVLDRLAVSALTKVISTLIGTFDEIEIQERIRDRIHYLRGKISGNELMERSWRRYIPQIKRTGPGAYSFEMHVIHGVSSLTGLLTDLHPDHLNALKSRVDEATGLKLTEAHPALEAIYTYKPMNLNPVSVIKAHESVAYLMDGDRFVTFDGRMFAFRAPCEVLLATDTRNQQFSVIAIFDSNGQLNGIKVEIREALVVIHVNGKVDVDNAAISMPWQKVDRMDGAVLISVHREDDWTVLTTYDDLQIRCQSQQSICEIKLPRRMFGRSNGLLGLNDHEPVNDHYLIDHTPNEKASLDVLAEHWTVIGQCRRNDAPSTFAASADSEQDCEAYFKSSSSPLKPCFSMIKPTLFHRNCENGAPAMRCTSASAYLQACSNIGLQLQLPGDCVLCANGLVKDESRTETTSNTVDVVFVVEERPCMEHHKDKIFQLAQRIGQQQRYAHFGYVGFGGEGVHGDPLVHYQDGKAILELSAFSRFQHDLKFESESGIEAPLRSAKNAVRFTAKHFPFRYASAKSIILMVCKVCSPDDRAKLLTNLLEQDITLHVMTTKKFKTSDGTKPVGASAKQLFDERGAQIGHRSSLLQPGDACTMVAQQTNGTVFSLKYGAPIAANSVASKKLSTCLQCQCIADALHGRTVCRPCVPVVPAETVFHVLFKPTDNPRKHAEHMLNERSLLVIR